MRDIEPVKRQGLLVKLRLTSVDREPVCGWVRCKVGLGLLHLTLKVVPVVQRVSSSGLGLLVLMLKAPLVRRVLLGRLVLLGRVAIRGVLWAILAARGPRESQRVR